VSGAQYRDRRDGLIQPRERHPLRALAKLTDRFAGTCSCRPHRSICTNSQHFRRPENYVKVPCCPPGTRPAITWASNARRCRTQH